MRRFQAFWNILSVKTHLNLRTNHHSEQQHENTILYVRIIYQPLKTILKVKELKKWSFKSINAVNIQSKAFWFDCFSQYCHLGMIKLKIVKVYNWCLKSSKFSPTDLLSDRWEARKHSRLVNVSAKPLCTAPPPQSLFRH